MARTSGWNAEKRSCSVIVNGSGLYKVQQYLGSNCHKALAAKGLKMTYIMGVH
jgi:hypothetical protein